MSYSAEVPDLASANAYDDETLIADYDELFEEVDFEALGIDPGCPTIAKPGSEEKVIMLAARYAAGLPLWHNSDCYDHGPANAAPEVEEEEVEEEEEFEF
jgi:hypothetical protein